MGIVTKREYGASGAHKKKPNRIIKTILHSRLKSARFFICVAFQIKRTCFDIFNFALLVVTSLDVFRPSTIARRSRRPKWNGDNFQEPMYGISFIRSSKRRTFCRVVLYDMPPSRFGLHHRLAISVRAQLTSISFHLFMFKNKLPAFFVDSL